MKRFFGVFSIIMLIFLALAAGSLLGMQYFAVSAESSSLQFVGGWGATAIYYDSSVSGSLFLIQPAPGGIEAGSVLYVASDGRLRAGSVTGGGGGQYEITSIGGKVQQVPVGNVKAVYRYQIPYLADIFNSLKTPLAIGLFAGVQVLSILLWMLLPGRGERVGRAERAERAERVEFFERGGRSDRTERKPKSRAAAGTLSPHDGDISSTIV